MRREEDRQALNEADRAQLAPLVGMFLRAAETKSAPYFDLFMTGADYIIEGMKKHKTVTAGMLNAADHAVSSEKASVREKAVGIYAAASRATLPKEKALALASRAVDALTRVLASDRSRHVRFAAATALRAQQLRVLNVETRAMILAAVLPELESGNRDRRRAAIQALQDPALVQRNLINPDRASATLAAVTKALNSETDGSLRFSLETAKQTLAKIAEPRAPGPIV